MNTMMLARPLMAVLLPLPMSLHRSRLVLPAMLHSASEEELAGLTVVALKQRLRELGRPVSGKKADLIARIRGEAAAGAGPAVGPTDPAAAAPSSPPPSSSSTTTASRSVVPMDATPRRRRGGAEPEPARTLRVASWNVAGLRGLLKREEGRATLRHLVASEQVDVVMLQATVLHCHLHTTACY